MRIALLLLLAVTISACAHTGPDPCIGSFEARKAMPCKCPGTLSPDCVPFPSDAKRKRPPLPPTTD